MKVLIALAAIVLAAQALHYNRVGCFRDNGSRAIAGGIRFRGSIDKCANYAKAHHWRMFAIQNGGECFTGPHAQDTYDKFGKANNCAHGKGGGWANEVYEVPGWHHYFLSAHWIKMHQMALQRMRQIRAEQAKRARYQRLMKTQRVRFNKAVAAYNASVKRLHTYNNKRNVAAANARRYNHMYTVYKSHRAAQLRAAAAQRAQCAKAQAAMNKNAASHAANMRKYKALYNRYNNQARTYTNNYNKERTVMMRTNKARVSAMNTLNKYTSGYNAANKRVARLNG